MHLLGDTLDKIAFHKSGLISDGAPCVLGPNVVQEVFEKRASEMGSKLFHVKAREDCDFVQINNEIARQVVGLYAKAEGIEVSEAAYEAGLAAR